MQCRYMIDNVVNMIEGLKNGQESDLLLASADPLGYFPEIRNIKVMEGDDYSGLYRDVLIDTPVGPYFMRFLEAIMGDSTENRNMDNVQQIFKDVKPEFIRTSLKKMWLEDFNAFCDDKLSGQSRSEMMSLIAFEADFKTI
jgi:V-type H+-transporting ATPase subunit d